MSNHKDFYKQIKDIYIQKAHEVTQDLREKLPLKNPRETLKESIKIAALGNTIDTILRFGFLLKIFLYS